MSNSNCNILNKSRLQNRSIDELIGLCAGIIADGSIHYTEAEFLQKWLINNKKNEHPIIKSLTKKIDNVLKDKILDDEETKDLLETLTCFSGSNFEMGEVQKSTTLPIDNFCKINIKDSYFVLTGTFAHDLRKNIEKYIVEIGGNVQRQPTLKTDYLIIGTYVTESWRHSSFGNKILTAIEMYENQKSNIKIISEQRFFIEIASQALE